MNFDINKPEIIEKIKLILPHKNTIIYTTVPRGIVLSIDQSELFETNSFCISDNGKLLLNKIAEFLRDFENDFMVEVHEDNSEEVRELSSSDWEISIMKASLIADYLTMISGIESDRITAIGFGELMPFKENVAPFDFSDNRVDFVIFDYKVIP